MTGATPEPVVDSAPLAQSGAQRIALGAVLVSAAAHVVVIGGFALLEWSPDTRPGTEEAPPVLVDIVADDPDALPPGRKAAAKALPMQQLASAAAAADPLASVQGDEAATPADAPQSSAPLVPPEAPEEAVAAAETPVPLLPGEPALASDAATTRTDVAAASDTDLAETVKPGSADNTESLPADAPTAPATDTAEIDPSAATAVEAPALAETESPAALSPEAQAALAAPSDPPLQAPADDAVEIDPSAATSVEAPALAEESLAALSPEAQATLAAPGGPALQAAADDAVEIDPSTATSAPPAATDAPALAGLSAEDRPAPAPSAEPGLQAPAADAAEVGSPVTASAAVPAIAETVPLAGLLLQGEAAMAAPAEPALQAAAVPLSGPAAPIDTAATSVAGLPPAGQTPLMDQPAQGAAISAVTDAVPVSASDRPPPIETVQAPAGDTVPANVAPIDGDVPSAVATPGPSAQPAVNPAALATPPVESGAAKVTSTGAVAPPAAAIPVDVPNQPAVVAPQAQPPAQAQTQLAALAVPPAVELRAFDPNEQIEALLLRLDCARLDASFDAESGEVSLAGRLSSDADRSTLVEQISAIAGVQGVEASALRVLGKPYCEILELLNRPELARSDELRHDVAKLGEAVPDIQRLPVGAPLSLSFHAPDFASYVYVAYLSSDGTVSHLLPDSFPARKLEPREQFAIGDRGEGGNSITVAPPLGLDIVLALASSEPLFLEPRKQGEPISDYLRALGNAIDGLHENDPSAKFEYSYHPIEVVAGDGP